MKNRKLQFYLLSTAILFGVQIVFFEALGMTLLMWLGVGMTGWWASVLEMGLLAAGLCLVWSLLVIFRKEKQAWLRFSLKAALMAWIVNTYLITLGTVIEWLAS